MTGMIRIHNETLVQSDIQEVQDALESHRLRLLSLRGCQLRDQQFWLVARALGRTRSLLQLGLNLGVLQGQLRVNMLAQALHSNRSITALLLHGSGFGARGMMVLGPALAMHPSIVTLDLGSCDLTDEAVMHVVPLLHRQGAKLGVKDLTLSFNPRISSAGWVQFALGLASSSELQQLALDHTSLGDDAFRCLVVAMAACPSMETLDLEETDITDEGAKVLVQMLEIRRTNLRKVIVKGTKVKRATRERIGSLLQDNWEDMDEGSINSETGETPTAGPTSATPRFRSNVTLRQAAHNPTAMNSTLITPPPNNDVLMRDRDVSSDPDETPLQTLSSNLKDIEDRLVQIIETKGPSPANGHPVRFGKSRLSLDNTSAMQSDDSGSFIVATSVNGDCNEISGSKKKSPGWVPSGRQSIDDALIHAMMAARGTITRADLARLSKGEVPADLVLPTTEHPLHIRHIRQDSLGSVHLDQDEIDLASFA